MELNTGRIPAYSNILTKAPIEPAGEKRTQVEGLWG